MMKAEPKPTQAQAERDATMRWFKMRDSLDRRAANAQPRKLG